MFDWARGEVLKQLVEQKVPLANWEGWLKGWAHGWTNALLEVPAGARIIDVGCGSSPYYAKHFAQHGCEAHVLERYSHEGPNPVFGISAETLRQHPEITFHHGLAGQNVAPEAYFDLVTCISVIEHIYDRDHVIDASGNFRHWLALDDLVRMLAPGGVLVVTYDFILQDYVGMRGWDYLADVKYLETKGIPLLNRSRRLRDRTFLYNYDDTLFMTFEGILSFQNRFRRQTAVGMMFRKPGSTSKVVLSPSPTLRDVLFSEPN
jgi:hypothetical protein